VAARPALAALRRDANRAMVQSQPQLVQPGAELPKELLSLINQAAAAKNVRGGSRAFRGHTSSLLNKGNKTHEKSAIVEQLEDWKDHNMALRSKSGPEHSPAVMKELSKENWETTLKSFVNNENSRFVFNQGNNDAQKYIIADFKKSGLTVTQQTFMLSFSPYEANAVNIIGELKGSTHPEEFVVLAAHYDSIPEKDSAPGADDNGSGVACLLSVARAFNKGLFKPKRSIRFVAFTAEEVGLKGSAEYVSQLSGTDRENFRGAIIMDQVGFRRDHSKTEVIFETSGRDKGQQVLVDTMAHGTKNIPGWGPGAQFQVNYAGWGSDHMSFLDTGLPAVLLIEKDNLWSADHYGHTAKDNLDNIDYQFGSNVATIAAVSIGNLADPSTL